MKSRYVVIDDEPLARKLVIAHTSKIDALSFAGEFGNALMANQFLRTNPVDLIFLDIQMPEMNGFQFIDSLKHPPAVILTTAHRNFAPEAFELDAIDYLMKPISFERLLKAVNKFLDRNQPNTEKLIKTEEETFVYVKADRKMHKIFLDDIIFIESLDEYIRIHMTGRVLVSRENITTMESRLSGKGFVRIHRSFIVSRQHISAVSSDGVELAGRIFPFGRTYKMAAISALGLNIK